MGSLIILLVVRSDLCCPIIAATNTKVSNVARNALVNILSGNMKKDEQTCYPILKTKTHRKGKGKDCVIQKYHYHLVGTYRYSILYMYYNIYFFPFTHKPSV